MNWIKHKTRRKWLLNLLRVLVSLVLMVYILLTIDLSALADSFRTANWWMLLLDIAIVIIATFISATRWTILLRAIDYRLTVFQVWRILQTSAFYGLFAPGLMGRELARWLKLSDQLTASRTSVAVSVLIDRLLGLTTLIILGAVVSLVMPSNLIPPIARWLVIGLLVGALSFWLAMMISVENILPAPLQTQAARLLDALGSRVKLVNRIIDSILAYRGQWLSIAHAAGWSFLYHATNALLLVPLTWAVDLEVSYLNIFFVYTVSAVLTSIPISVAGIGVRDISYISLLSQMGYPQSRVASLPVLSLGIRVAWALVVGGGIELLEGARGVAQGPSDQADKPTTPGS